MDERQNLDCSPRPVERAPGSPRRLLAVLGLGELYMLFLVLIVGLILTTVLVIRFPGGNAVRDMPATPTPIASAHAETIGLGIQ